MQSPLRPRRHAMFLGAHGRVGNFAFPRTFNEKVNWRILNDRRSALAWTCDKLVTKDRAALVGLNTPKTIWFGTDVTELAGNLLSDAWVLKPNHRSGIVHFGSGPIDRIEDIQVLTSGWLDDPQSERLGEWAYSQARRLILVEQRLSPACTAVDYKVYVIGGEPYVIQVDTGRFSEHTRRFYRPDWTARSDIVTLKLGPILPAPEGLEEMLRGAVAMVGDLEFLRVDFYQEDRAVYLGEVTPYPCSGLERFVPPDLDLEMGRAWVLPRRARRLRV